MARDFTKKVEDHNGRYQELRRMHLGSVALLENLSRFRFIFEGDIEASKRLYHEASLLRKQQRTVDEPPPPPWTVCQPIRYAHERQINKRYLASYKRRVAIGCAGMSCVLFLVLLAALLPLIAAPTVVNTLSRPLELHKDLLQATIEARSLQLNQLGQWAKPDESAALADVEQRILGELAVKLHAVGGTWPPVQALHPLTYKHKALLYETVAPIHSVCPMIVTQSVADSVMRAAQAAEDLAHIDLQGLSSTTATYQYLAIGVPTHTFNVFGGALGTALAHVSEYVARVTEGLFTGSMVGFVATCLAALAIFLISQILVLMPLPRVPATILSVLVDAGSHQTPADPADLLEAAGYPASVPIPLTATVPRGRALLDDLSTPSSDESDIETGLLGGHAARPSRAGPKALARVARLFSLHHVVKRELENQFLLGWSSGRVRGSALRGQRANLILSGITTVGTVTLFTAAVCGLFLLVEAHVGILSLSEHIHHSLQRQVKVEQVLLGAREVALVAPYPLPDPDHCMGMSDINERRSTAEVADLVTRSLDDMWKANYDALLALPAALRYSWTADGDILDALDQLYRSDSCVRTSGPCVDAAGHSIWHTPHPAYPAPVDLTLPAGLSATLELWAFNVNDLIFGRQSVTSYAFSVLWDVGGMDIREGTAQATELYRSLLEGLCGRMAWTIVLVLSIGILGGVLLLAAWMVRYTNYSAQYQAVGPLLHLLGADTQATIQGRVAKHLTPTPMLEEVDQSTEVYPAAYQADPRPAPPRLSVSGSAPSAPPAGPEVAMMVVRRAGEVTATTPALDALLGTLVGADVYAVLQDPAPEDVGSWASHDWAMGGPGGNPFSGGRKVAVVKRGPVFDEVAVETSVLDAGDTLVITIKPV